MRDVVKREVADRHQRCCPRGCCRRRSSAGRPDKGKQGSQPSVMRPGPRRRRLPAVAEHECQPDCRRAHSGTMANIAMRPATARVSAIRSDIPASTSARMRRQCAPPERGQLEQRHPRHLPGCQNGKRFTVADVARCEQLCLAELAVRVRPAGYVSAQTTPAERPRQLQSPRLRGRASRHGLRIWCSFGLRPGLHTSVDVAARRGRVGGLLACIRSVDAMSSVYVRDGRFAERRPHEIEIAWVGEYR
jgi:hypothetical protein